MLNNLMNDISEITILMVLYEESEEIIFKNLEKPYQSLNKRTCFDMFHDLGVWGPPGGLLAPSWKQVPK